MDRNNVQMAMIGIGPEKGEGRSMVEAHPDRFFGCHEPDPNDVPGMLRTVRQLHRDAGLKAVTAFPSGRDPQVPIDDPKMYELYELCCELGIPIFCCAGIPGPRVPFAPQRVELIDQVMYDFPDLVFVTRHGCEPWQDLMVKLMLKWPNLYYSTSAFAPKHYPKAIIDYANSRGADKVIYAGYFPMGLSLDRIFTELRDVPFKAEVWPKFLRENAIRVLGLDA
jgi:predicted TIM-barrel fold metal-dependent hydrolase